MQERSEKRQLRCFEYNTEKRMDKFLGCDPHAGTCSRCNPWWCHVVAEPMRSLILSLVWQKVEEATWAVDLAGQRCEAHKETYEGRAAPVERANTERVCTWLGWM